MRFLLSKLFVLVVFHSAQVVHTYYSFFLPSLEQTEDPREKTVEFLTRFGLGLEHADDIVNEVLAARPAAAESHDDDDDDGDDEDKDEDNDGDKEEQKDETETSETNAVDVCS